MWDSGNGNIGVSLSEEGVGEVVSKRVESFRSPSKSAKLTRSGSSISAGGVATGTSGDGGGGHVGA